MGIVYIICGLLAAIGVLWIILKISIAKRKSAELKAKSAIDAKAQSDIVITEQIRRKNVAQIAQEAQNNKRRTDQQHSDEGVRDAFDNDTF